MLSEELAAAAKAVLISMLEALDGHRLGSSSLIAGEWEARENSRPHTQVTAGC